MPARDSVKQYVKGGFYHVYNRGVERRRIFLDDQDYRSFLHLLKFYLSTPDVSENHPLKELTGFNPVRPRPLTTLYKKVELHCYCLMPNHFHLLVRQLDKEGMEKLLRSLLTTYAMYFNRRYERVGHLFQGTYKAALVENDNYFLHLSRYIHQNPPLKKGYLSQYPYSSYPNYLGEKESEWLNTTLILSFFTKSKIDKLNLNGLTTYKQFVERYRQDPKEIIGKLAIDRE